MQDVYIIFDQKGVPQLYLGGWTTRKKAEDYLSTHPLSNKYWYVDVLQINS